MKSRLGIVHDSVKINGRIFQIHLLFWQLRGGSAEDNEGIKRIFLDGDIQKQRQPLHPWQKRRRRPRPRDHRISPVNQPFARVLPTDRPEQPSYYDRRRRLLGSFAEVHARAVADLPPITNTEDELPALMDDDDRSFGKYVSPPRNTTCLILVAA